VQIWIVNGLTRRNAPGAHGQSRFDPTVKAALGLEVSLGLDRGEVMLVGDVVKYDETLFLMAERVGARAGTN
jgi:hypothetical protein